MGNSTPLKLYIPGKLKNYLKYCSLTMLLYGASSCSDPTIVDPDTGIIDDDTEVLGFAMHSDIDSWSSRSAGTDTEGFGKVETAIPLKSDDSSDNNHKFLFLKVGDITDSKPESAESRGYEVTGTNYRNHYQKVGLTGICFSGDWDNPIAGTEHVYYIVNDSIKMYKDPSENYDFRWKPDENYYWSGIHQENIRFFAYAPYNAGVEFDTQRVLDGETAKFNYTTPADITQQVDLSADAITCPGDFRRTVPLQFHHILSQINFSVGDPILAGTIHSIRVKGVKSKGTYTYNYDRNVLTSRLQNPENIRDYQPGEWSNIRDTMQFYLKKEIPLPGDERDPSVGGDKNEFDDGCVLGPWYGEGWGPDDKDRPYLTNNGFTLFLLPQELTEDVIVEIEMSLPGSKVPLTYRAPLYTKEHPSWEPGKKYEYMISNDVLVQYFLYFNSHFDPKMSYPKNTADKLNGLFYNHDLYSEPYDTLYYKAPYTGSFVNRFVQSFMIMTQVNKKGDIVSQQREEIEWHPVYCDKDGNEIEKPDWITFSYDEAGGNVTVKPQVAFAVLNKHNKKLREAEPVGSRDNPLDLSLTYNGLMNTANTYMINAPGWYKFPLVYGNAIKNGADNPASYSVNAAPQMAKYHVNDMLYPNLVDHNDKAIRTPWIRSQVRQLRNPKVVWQNAYNLVDPDSLEIRGDYLVMYISPITIGQGNANVAVHDAAGNIAWSWHIWATDFVADAAQGSTTASTPEGETFSFMDVDLGWHFPEPDVDENGQEREVFLKLKQHRHTTEDKADQMKPVDDNKSQFYTALSKDRLRIVQAHYEVTKSGVVPYYQWGRPTPAAIMPHVRAGYPLHATVSDPAYPRRLFNIPTVSITLGNGRVLENYPATVVTSSRSGGSRAGEAPVQDNNMPSGGQTIRIDVARHMNQDISIGTGIRNPHVFFHYELTDFPGSIDYHAGGYNINSAGTGLTWWGTGDAEHYFPNKTYPDDNATFQAYWNLWCMTNDGRSDALTKPDDNIVKTVYDPCPVGFCVAPSRAFNCFSRDKFANAPYGGDPEGGWGYRFNADDGIIFFSASGWMVENFPYTTPSYLIRMWPEINFGGELMTSSASARWYNTQSTGSTTSAFHIAYKGNGSNSFLPNYTSSPIFGQPVRPIREK